MVDAVVKTKKTTQPKTKDKVPFSEEQKQMTIKVVLIVVLALILGIGGGSLIFYFLIPRPNPETQVVSTFRIPSENFVKVDLDIPQFPQLKDEKLFVAERIYDWVIAQKDRRGPGLYVPMADCTYLLETGEGNCTNPNKTDATFFSNRSFQAPLWGMYKYYQNTKDELVLKQLESDLKAVKEVILDQPDLYYIQNNDYSCIFLKDLYFGEGLSEESKGIIADICAKSEYEVMLSPIDGFDYEGSIARKIQWLRDGQFDQAKLEASYQELGLTESRLQEHLLYGSDFQITADIMAAALIAPDSQWSQYVKPQLDILLTQYAYLLSKGQVTDHYNSGLVLGLAYYAKFFAPDAGVADSAMLLASSVYNNSFKSGEMTIDDLMDFVLVQYHLGFPMSQIQSYLLTLFYDPQQNNFGDLTPFYYQLPGSAIMTEQRVFSRGSILQNGLIMGVLSI